jgi:hypothetical protein
VRTQRDDRAAALEHADDAVGALADVLESDYRACPGDSANDVVHEASLCAKSRGSRHIALALPADLGYSRSVDPDLELKRRSGGAMVTWGIVILVGALLVTCGVSATRANRSNPYGEGFEGAATPMALGLIAGVALIAVGSAKKANANREWRDRQREASMTTELVPSDKVPGGPFRGALEEVHKPSASFEAMEVSERADRHQRGTTYLTIGIVILTLTVIGSVMLMSGGSHTSPHERAERILLTFGGAMLPMGIGLWLTIKGGLMRSKG